MVSNRVAKCPSVKQIKKRKKKQVIAGVNRGPTGVDVQPNFVYMLLLIAVITQEGRILYRKNIHKDDIQGNEIIE